MSGYTFSGLGRGRDQSGIRAFGGPQAGATTSAYGRLKLRVQPGRKLCWWRMYFISLHKRETQATRPFHYSFGQIAMEVDCNHCVLPFLTG